VPTGSSSRREKEAPPKGLPRRRRTKAGSWTLPALVSHERRSTVTEYTVAFAHASIEEVEVPNEQALAAAAETLEGLEELLTRLPDADVSAPVPGEIAAEQRGVPGRDSQGRRLGDPGRTPNRRPGPRAARPGGEALGVGRRPPLRRERRRGPGDGRLHPGRQEEGRRAAPAPPRPTPRLPPGLRRSPGCRGKGLPLLGGGGLGPDRRGRWGRLGQGARSFRGEL
jgi:hypothetical protein